jgi:hypothetical protein
MSRKLMPASPPARDIVLRLLTIAISICFAGLILCAAATMYFGYSQIVYFGYFSFEIAGILLCLGGGTYCIYRHYRS